MPRDQSETVAMSSSELNMGCKAGDLIIVFGINIGEHCIFPLYTGSVERWPFRRTRDFVQVVSLLVDLRLS